jgi:hypothetical protein
MRLDTIRIKCIKTLVKESCMDDDTYHAMLANGYNVNSCVDLTPEQADTLIVTLKTALGHTVNLERVPRRSADGTLAAIEGGSSGVEKQFASPAMLRRIKFHCIRCAIRYASAATLGSYCAEGGGTGEILQGDELRRWLGRRFESIRTDDPYKAVEMPIPGPILRRLYTDWINPTSNRFLVEGGFKKYTIAPEKLYYHELSPEAAGYLITRYRAMHAMIDAHDTRAQAPII